MKKINLSDLPFEEWGSPGGKFRGLGRQVSIALGAKPDANRADGGHPFDLEYGRLPPRKAGCPFHSHSAQFELFVIVSGRGTVRHGTFSREIRAGEAVMHPPGEAHQLINTGDTDLDYLLIADNPTTEAYHYPDSNKWGFRPNGGFFLREDVDYNLGEEDGAPTDRRAPKPRPGSDDGNTLARFVTIESIPETERRSPKGRYHSFARDISIELGGVRDTGTWAGGHPFDLQQRRVPPGAAVCPLHSHTMQWEMFIILAGTATVRQLKGETIVGPGDVFIQPPGTAHQIRNSGSTDLLFYVVADNTSAEICFYPDSNKWMIDPQRKCFRMVEVNYFDGEE